MNIISQRVVLVHGHIFKNAGTSLDKILHHNFAEKFCDHRKDELMHEGGQHYLDRYIFAHPGLLAISSHCMPLPLESSDGVNYKTIVLLRDPVERIGSVYRFERQQQADTPGAQAAKKYNLSDYLRWRFDHRPIVVANYFTHYCTSVLPRNTPIEERFKVANRFIGNCYMVGVVDRFNQSLLVLKQKLLSDGQVLEISDVHENSTASSQLSILEKRQQLMSALGDTLYDEVERRNSLDMALYQTASDQLSTEIIHVKHV